MSKSDNSRGKRNVPIIVAGILLMSLGIIGCQRKTSEQVEINYTYDEQGKLILCEHNYVQWESYDISYEYDSEGKLEKRTKQSGDVNGEYTIYKYSDEGLMVDSKTYELNGVLLSKDEYNDKGYLTVSRFYYSDGRVEKYIEYEYDSNGNKTKETYFTPDSTEMFSIEYQYDQSGFLIGDNYLTTNTYENDSYGNVIKEESFDANGELTSYVIYTNEYDNDNHLIKSKGEIISYTYY